MVAYSFKKRFVTLIRWGMGKATPAEISDMQIAGLEPKLQTIRAPGKRKHAIPGDAMQLYYAMRTKQCTKIADGYCSHQSEIRLMFGTNRDVVLVHGDRLYLPEELDLFARADGFQDWRDMKKFWNEEHDGITDFTGVLIKWKRPPL